MSNNYLIFTLILSIIFLVGIVLNGIIEGTDWAIIFGLFAMAYNVLAITELCSRKKNGEE